jgi:hypothetical protein
VGIAPGNLFSIDDSYSDFLRLPFVLSENEITLGIEKLVESWRELKGVPTSGDHRFAVVI